ncbi:MAG: zinc ribbon domain-containing protein [Chloroflexota bacterium]
MSETLSHERKLCPNCGHSNRASVKVCPQCGYAFLASTGGFLRKRCAACGHMNRLGAKVCSHCGHAFQGKVTALQSEGQKWCPVCGKRRGASAKVCSSCGYRFKLPVRVPAVPEQPIVQSETLAEPIKLRKTTSAPPTPKVPSLSGEPAPYISPEELKRLREMGTQDPGLFVRLYHVLRDNKT